METYGVVQGYRRMHRDIQGITRAGNAGASKNDGSIFESSHNKDCPLLNRVFEGDSPPHLVGGTLPPTFPHVGVIYDLATSTGHHQQAVSAVLSFCCGAYLVLAKHLVSKGFWYEDIQ